MRFLNNGTFQICMPRKEGQYVYHKGDIHFYEKTARDKKIEAWIATFGASASILFYVFIRNIEVLGFDSPLLLHAGDALKMKMLFALACIYIIVRIFFLYYVFPKRCPKRRKVSIPKDIDWKYEIKRTIHINCILVSFVNVVTLFVLAGFFYRNWLMGFFLGALVLLCMALVPFPYTRLKFQYEQLKKQKVREQAVAIREA